MPCYHPSEVPVRRKSMYPGRQESYLQVVPCGNCIGCRAEQTRQWAVRMMHEERMHKHSFFLTLTYDEGSLPENASLCPKHLSGFVSRMRKAWPSRRLSFFGCGEYGERTQRPHYHAMCYGAPFYDKYDGFDDSRSNIWRSESLNNLWGHGGTELGSVTMASASYVAGYIRKKQRSKDRVRCNPATGELLEPEFARMSLRPAIGRRWIERNWRDVYPRDFVVVDGVEAKPPRYYDKWMETKFPFIMEEVRQKRFDEMEDLTPYQLTAAEKIHQSRINLFEARAGV